MSATPAHRTQAGTTRLAGVGDRTARPLALFAVSAASAVALWRVSRRPDLQVDWRHLNRWLERTTPTDAVVAIVTLIGVLLAVYTALVTGLYLLAAATRQRWLARLARRVALPPLRGLLDAALASSIVVGALAAPARADIAPPAPRARAAAVNHIAPASRTDTPAPTSETPAPQPPRSLSAPTTAATTATHTVRHGESWASISHEATGDWQDWTTIAALNAGHEVAPGVHYDGDAPPEAGWTVLVPTGGQGAPESTHVVERDESIWRIAKDHLADVHDAPPIDAEVAAYKNAMIDANRDRLAEPNNPGRIYAGQVLIEPAIGPPAPPPDVLLPPSPSVGTPEPAASTSAPPHAAPTATTIPPPAATTTTPPTTAPDRPSDGQPARPVVIRLPSGSVVGLSFAAGFVANLALAALHRRRAYKPAPPRSTRPVAFERADEPIRSLAQVVANTGGSSAVMSSSTRRDPAPALVEAGVSIDSHGDARVVNLDPLQLGVLLLGGPGAGDVARAMVASLVVRDPFDMRVIIDAVTAASVLGADQSFAGFTVEAAPDDVIAETQIERARRARVLASVDCDDFCSYRADPTDEHLEGLVVVAKPTGDDVSQWETALSNATRLGIGAVLLCDQPASGNVIAVDDDGTVVRAEGDAAHLTGVCLHRLTRDDAVAIFRKVAATRALAEHPEPAAQVVEEPFPVASLPPDTTTTNVRPVRLDVLGTFTLRAGDEIIRDGLLDKARELLAYLTLFPDGVRRERIMEDLWGDVDPDKRQDRFSAAVSNIRGRLRKALGRPDLEFVCRHHDRYRLEVDLYDVDLWRFEQATDRVEPSTNDNERTDHLQTALAAYGGEFAADELWEWLNSPRSNIQRRALDNAIRLAEIHARAGRLDRAIAAVEHAIEKIDPVAEDVFVRGVDLRVAAGRPDSAQSLYKTLRDRLDDLLDDEPMPETSAAIGKLLSRARVAINAASVPQDDAAIG